MSVGVSTVAHKTTDTYKAFSIKTTILLGKSYIQIE